MFNRVVDKTTLSQYNDGNQAAVRFALTQILLILIIITNYIIIDNLQC